MPFSLISLPHWSARPGSFTKKFTFRTGTEEQEQVIKAVKRARDNQCRIYILTNNEENYGFIAVSLSTVESDELPMLVLDYLFVSLQYRGAIFPELGELKIADYLLAQALQLAVDITYIAPVRYLGLEPASDQLSGFYKRRGFKKLDRTEWLFAVVPKPTRT